MYLDFGSYSVSPIHHTSLKKPNDIKRMDFRKSSPRSDVNHSSRGFPPFFSCPVLSPRRILFGAIPLPAPCASTQFMFPLQRRHMKNSSLGDSMNYLLTLEGLVLCKPSQMGDVMERTNQLCGQNST